MALTPPIPIHCPKLVSPNTAPSTAPPNGPQEMAAIATGIILNVIASGPILRYPSGVYDISTKTAIMSPNTVNCFVDNFFVFIFLSLMLNVNIYHRDSTTAQGTPQGRTLSGHQTIRYGIRQLF